MDEMMQYVPEKLNDDTKLMNECQDIYAKDVVGEMMKYVPKKLNDDAK